MMEITGEGSGGGRCHAQLCGNADDLFDLIGVASGFRHDFANPFINLPAGAHGKNLHFK